MFVIEPETNSIIALIRKSFSELGFKERKHLQEWIAGNPEALGEKLLIIQKEFNGFSETNERLDLLALDKNGNLVIIENKLDDSGRDVTWQALKYASYCSTLKKEDIKAIYQSFLDTCSQSAKAEEKILEFLEEEDFAELVLNQSMKQRIILIAAKFRKEVTSTVLWLTNFKIQLQCFKVSPYALNGQFFLTLEQIIPTKDAQDYVISMATKAQEEISTEEEIKNRHKIRLRFWAEFLKAIRGKSSLFQNSGTTKEYTLYAGGPGITYVSYQAVISGTKSAVKLHFGRASQVENKILFDALEKHKAEIENKFGTALMWERDDNLKRSAVSFYKNGQNYFNEEEWPQIINFLIENLNKLESALKAYMPGIKAALANSIKEMTEPLEDELPTELN